MIRRQVAIDGNIRCISSTEFSIVTRDGQVEVVTRLDSVKIDSNRMLGLYVVTQCVALAVCRTYYHSDTGRDSKPQ